MAALMVSGVQPSTGTSDNASSLTSQAQGSADASPIVQATQLVQAMADDAQVQLPDPMSNATPGSSAGGSNTPSGASTTTLTPSTPEPSKPTTGVRPEEWKSNWLQARIICTLCAITLALIGTIIGLAVYSKEHHGIASADMSLQIVASIIPDFYIGIGLLWSTLPVLIFNIYVMLIAAVVKAAGDRQPYIELYSPEGNDVKEGAAAEKSIQLDYNAYASIVAPVKALKYNHYTLASSFAILFVVNLMLSSLVADLFSPTPVAMAKDVSVQRTARFDNAGFATKQSLTPALGIVSGTLVYGGKPLPWTTQNASFLSFSLEPWTGHGGTSKNLSIPTLSYSVSLDCQILGPSEFELLMAEGANWYFSMVDRGCSQSNQIFVAAPQPYISIVQTYAYEDCGEATQQSRIVVIGAIAGNTSSELTNKTAVSCIPSYYNSTGILRVTIDPSTPEYPTINSFIPSNPAAVESPPSFAYNFETMLQLGGSQDPTSTLFAGEYGSLIYNYAKQLSPTFFMNGETLLNATQSSFPAAFAAMAKQYLMQPGRFETVRGTLYTPETRVVVVPAVAYTIVAILIAILVMLGWLWRYSQQRHSILYEEPSALLGAACILRDSQLMQRVAAIDADKCGGKVMETFIKEHASHPPAEGWVFERLASLNDSRIVSTPSARQFGYPRPWRK